MLAQAGILALVRRNGSAQRVEDVCPNILHSAVSADQSVVGLAANLQFKARGRQQSVHNHVAPSATQNTADNPHRHPGLRSHPQGH